MSAGDGTWYVPDLGLQVAIDDFGTGYSSMQHLHRLPVDQLKIDRSFVGRLGTDSSAEAIVRASINLANDLGLEVVAEGVEDEHALQLLCRLGCQQVQGFYLSRPLPLAEFIRWAIEWNPEWLVRSAGRSLEPARPAERVAARGM